MFAVNTGCGSSEVCCLLWKWEVVVPELGTSVFIEPGQTVKNADDHLVVSNRVARSVVAARRGQHPTHVFAFEGKPVASMLDSAWNKARMRAGRPMVRVHHHKHTLE